MNTRVGNHSLLQGIFLTQESNLAFLHCRWILYHMSHQVSPLSTVLQSNSVLDYTVHGILQARVLEWVAIPFSRGSSQPRNRTWVSCITGRFFTTELPRKPCPITCLAWGVPALVPTGCWVGSGLGTVIQHVSYQECSCGRIFPNMTAISVYVPLVSCSLPTPLQESL